MQNAKQTKRNRSKNPATSLFTYGVPPTNPSAGARWEARQSLREFSKKEAQQYCGAETYGTLEWVTENGYTYLSGISKCKSPHSCPHCSPIRMADRRSIINIKSAQTLETGGMEAHATFTVPFSKPQNLRASYAELLAVAEKFRRIAKKIEAKYGITHSVRVLEETFSERTYWHPHFNWIFHIPQPLTDDEQDNFMDAMTAGWVHAANLAGISGALQSLQTVGFISDLSRALEANRYQTKHSKFPMFLPKPNAQGLFEGLKPFEVLALACTGDTYWIQVFNDFELATYRIQRVKFYQPRLKVATV